MSRRIVSRSKSSYFIEFLIIIAGIMVSYLLNDWRENKQIQSKKDQLLVDINHDLYADSLVLEQSKWFYNLVIKSHDSLLAGRTNTFNEDSLNTYLDHFTSYYPFQENNTTYTRILNDQSFTIEKEDSLLQYFMNLHTYVYPNIHEWLAIDRNFILETTLPYMDANSPFIYPAPLNKSFDGAVFYELRKKDIFMNYLKSGRVYKKSSLMVNEMALNYLKQVKIQFNKSIKLNSKKKK